MCKDLLRYKQRNKMITKSRLAHSSVHKPFVYELQATTQLTLHANKQTAIDKT